MAVQGASRTLKDEGKVGRTRHVEGEEAGKLAGGSNSYFNAGLGCSRLPRIDFGGVIKKPAGQLCGGGGEMSIAPSGSAHNDDEENEELSDSPFDGHIIEAYRSMCEVNEIVTSGAIALIAAESANLLESYDRFLPHYNFLVTQQMEAGFCAFNMTCKFHEMWHICNFAKYTNPRAHWCYSFEDFIGHIKRNGQACVAGTAMHNVPSKIVDNHLRALSLELEA